MMGEMRNGSPTGGWVGVRTSGLDPLFAGRNIAPSVGLVGIVGIVVALAGLLAVVAVPSAVAEESAERKQPETWHATAFVRGDMGIRVIDYWSKGPDMVARTLINGRPVTTIVSGGRYVVFDGVSGIGLNVARSDRALKQDKGRSRPFAFEYEEMREAGGEKIDDVNFGSRRGEIWQKSDATGRQKLWVSVGMPQIPLRLETFDRQSATNIELDYQNWIFDLEMPARFFGLPSGIDFETFEYDVYMAKSVEGLVGPMPILYPDLLHGEPPG